MKTNELDRGSRLLAWYDRHKRSLPFREKPVPYYIWISEIMLQQTRMETVIPYFNRFIQALPEIRDLAEVTEEDLMKLWEGLGYYSRARNLKKAAEVIMAEYGGSLPERYEDLVCLPGIGPYTAGAIASIAFGEQVPAVDGNVIRVYSRLEAYAGEVMKAAGKRFIHDSVLKDLPGERPGDYNQAIMELGATVCIPNSRPHCEKCPLKESCLAFQFGDPLAHPVLPLKKARRVEEHTVLLLIRDDHYLIEKREDEGLLAGLNQFPMQAGTLDEEALGNWLKDLGIRDYSLKPGLWAKHAFSHVEWHMPSWIVWINPELSYQVSEKAGQAEYRGEGRVRDQWSKDQRGDGLFKGIPGSDRMHWVPDDRLMRIAMPTAFRVFREELADLLKEKPADENRYL